MVILLILFILSKSNIIFSRSTYKIILNFYTEHYRAGFQDLDHEIIELVKKVFSNQSLIQKGFLLHSDYINAIQIAAGMPDFEWAEQILESNKHYLLETTRTDVIRYAKFCILYQKGRVTKNMEYYDQAIQLYNSIEKIPASYHLPSKTYMIRCYYEKLQNQSDEIEFLNYYCDAFLKHLSRSTSFNPKKRSLFGDFTQTVKSLLKFRNSPKATNSTLLKLQKEINSKKEVFAAYWIKEKIDELLKMGKIH